GGRIAAVFPGEVAVPVAPAHPGAAGDVRLTGQAEIADRHHPPAIRGAVAVGEGVKLLHVAEGLVRLPFHPRSGRRLERTMRGLNGPEGNAEPSAMVSTR